MCEPSDDWRWKFDGSPEPEKNELKPDSDESLKVPASRINASSEEDNGFSFPRGTPLSEDDDELTESKIKAFLDAKVLVCIRIGLFVVMLNLIYITLMMH